MKHISVLLSESIDALEIVPGDIILDGTLGGGGHTKEIIRRYGSAVKIIGIDLDSDALMRAEEEIKDMDHDTIFKVGAFQDSDKILESLKIPKVDRVLLDLGLSSFQIDISGRGFSFLRDEPLLMTMKKDPKEDDVTAIEVVNNWKEETLADIIYGFGEEKYARRIAKAIVEQRAIRKIETTKDLREIIENAVGGFYKKSKINPSTRTFQAIRIAVNTELIAIESALEKLWEKLHSNGRMVVISFHSLEDRIVKNFFRKMAQEEKGILINKKVIIPSNEEINKNPRSRSSKMRIIQKI